jgi:hypothetical protein
VSKANKIISLSLFCKLYTPAVLLAVKCDGAAVLSLPPLLVSTLFAVKNTCTALLGNTNKGKAFFRQPNRISFTLLT